jgi:hypothetical protein
MTASPKLQRAARTCLLRLVAENGPEHTMCVLSEIADETEWIARTCVWSASTTESRGHLKRAGVDLGVDKERALHACQRRQ